MKGNQNAVLIKASKETIIFSCPNCGKQYACPGYVRDFVCTHCFKIPYRFNYELKKRERNVWKDTFLTIK